ncbi:MAG: hypothetical protein QOD42_2662 [Sphingomonadales bacterium]|nr:hypothetical protein [Sphingomonadales bacterium]
MAEILVIMPFGLRTYLQGETTFLVDFDDVYANIIQPAIDRCGHIASRIDELTETGDISHHYLNRIVSAELVVADLSMPNGNVYYELGVRQAISNYPTILIAAEGTDLPFDVRNQRVLFYEEATDDGRKAAVDRLARWIGDIYAKASVNPVHQYLKTYGLVADPANGPAFEQDLRGKVERASNLEQLRAVWNWAKAFEPLPPFTLLALAEKFSFLREWKVAAQIVRAAAGLRPGDYEIHRTLGWYLRNSGERFYDEAEAEFRKALELNPGDLEALGMLGGLQKRRGRYPEAAETYGRGVREAPDNLYLKVAHAGMVLLADPGPGSAAIPLYEELRAICAEPDRALDPWAHAVAGEAEFVLDNDDGALDHYLEARRLAGSPTVLASPAEQLRLFGRAGYRSDRAAYLAARLEALAADLGVEAVAGDDVRPVAEESAAGPPADREMPVIIHLSDPHFGYRHDEAGKKVDMHRFRDGDYSITLESHIANEFNKITGRFRLDSERLFLVISGDIVYQAGSDEYEEALACLEALVRILGIGKDRLILCPGNHDVSWPDAKIKPERRFDNYLTFLVEFYGETIFRRLYPFVAWDFKINTARPHPTDLVSVARFPEIGMVFVGFNSCVYEDPQHHYGFIGGKQIRRVEKLLASAEFEKLTRIAVLHHHIHPYPEPVVLEPTGGHWHDVSTIRDAGLFERFLEKQRFDLVLHGHKHKPQLRETLVRDRTTPEMMRPLIVCGAGSCSVDARELEHAVPNHYQVIEFLSRSRIPQIEFLKLEWRELAVGPDSEWTTSRVWVVNG